MKQYVEVFNKLAIILGSGNTWSAAVCFGLAFSRLGVLGSVITIHALV